MIDNFSSLIEFVSAIYFTLYLEEVIKRKIWTPDYQFQLKRIVKSYSFVQDSTMKELNQISNQRGEEMQKQVSRKGLFMLFYCMFLLTFIGFETADNAHFALLIVELLSIIFIIFGNVLLSKWKHIIYAVVGCLFVYFIAYSVCINNVIPSNHIEDIAKRYMVLFLLVSLFLPILIQVFICWLYSSSYRGYLSSKFDEEEKTYKLVLEAIMNKDYAKVPKDYHDIIVKRLIESQKLDNDMCISEYVQMVNNRLVLAIQASWYKIFLSYLHFQFSRLFTNKHSDESIDQFITRTPHTYYGGSMGELLPQKYRVVNYQQEYEHFAKLKKQGQVINLKSFCATRNINLNEMIAWLNKYKPIPNHLSHSKK